MQHIFHLIKWTLYTRTMWIPDPLDFAVLKPGKMPEKVNWRDTSLENSSYDNCALKHKSISGPYLAQIKKIPQDEIRAFCDKSSPKRYKNQNYAENGK